MMPGRFVTALASEKVEEPIGWGRARWRLTQDLVYDSPLLGRQITVPAGFVTDFASVPRVPFAYWIAGDTAHEAATVHDWLLALGVPWELAAKVFREAMKASRVPAWRRELMYWAVRLAEPAPTTKEQPPCE